MAVSLNRRDFLKTIGCASIAGLFARTARAAGPVQKGYNVLFLMSDEHSRHVVGCYGNAIIKTPTLDALARQGLAFTSAYCQDPICVPSRASFVTGRIPSNVGVFGNDGGLDESVPTLADVFKKAGYVAGWMGKTHWGGAVDFDGPERIKGGRDVPVQKEISSRLPRDAQVSKWPLEVEPDTITKEQAIQFLEKNRDKRFFLGVSFRKPHFPFVVQEQYYNLYKDSVDMPRVTSRMIDELPKVSQNERTKYEFDKLTDEEIKKARAVYYGMVTYVDDLLKDILKKLDDLGLRDNTIILYTADHGEMAGEHGLWYKNSFYEGGVSIPFIWSFPKELPRNKKIDAPVMNMDIFPTLCDLCGLSKPDGLEGKSLLPLMNGTEDGKDRYALSENYRSGSASRMIRTPEWKYCYFHEDREQLFNMLKDPDEAVNLVNEPQYKNIVATLKARALEGWRRERTKQSSSKGSAKKSGDKKGSGKKASRKKANEV